MQNEVSTLDKYEYKIRSEEIRTLVAEGEYAEAVKIADTIDWRRVRSVMMLCMISDLYKINRRYQESKDILLLAYEKHPTGRLIVYSLCELSIKLGEYVQAMAYYNEFSQIAPKDTGRYILLYRLYEAQDVSLEERIAVLEEFKKRDYREKWAYELAYLYHRIGLTTKCVEECDEMFLWFGEGRYVVKALELKALHEPLSEDQQAKYDAWIRERDEEVADEETEESGEDTASYEEPESVPATTQVAGKIPHASENVQDEVQTIEEMPTTELPEIRAVDVGQYNTINLQAELAGHVKEVLGGENPAGVVPVSEAASAVQEEVQEITAAPVSEAVSAMEAVAEAPVPEAATAAPQPVATAQAVAAGEPQAATEVPISKVAPAVQEEVQEITAAPVSEAVSATEAVAEVPVSEAAVTPEPEAEQPVIGGEPQAAAEVPAFKVAPTAHEEVQEITAAPASEAVSATEVAAEVPVFGMATSAPQPEPVATAQPVAAGEPQAATGVPISRVAPTTHEEVQEITSAPVFETVPVAQQPVTAQPVAAKEPERKIVSFDRTAREEATVQREEPITPLNTRPSRFDKILSQEYDGQISLVVPDAERVEKQITGQLSIDDIMAEWEQMKKTNEQKRMEDVRRHILAQTGSLFDNFDEATKNGLLEELERAFVAAIRKEAEKPGIKKVILPEDAEEELKQPKKEEVKEESKSEPVTDEITQDDAVEELEEIEEVTDTEEATAEDELQKAQEPEAAEESEEQTETAAESRETVSPRELTDEEKELFGRFVHHRKSRQQLVNTLDNMSLASYTGNVLLTGEEEDTVLALAKGLIREMQVGDGNFSGKVAKISGSSLNKKNIEETFGRLDNGALIIEKAAGLNKETAAKIGKALEKDNKGLLLLMADSKQKIDRFMEKNAVLAKNFNLRIDVEALDDESLVEYAKLYAQEQEYSIDDFGVLALHTRIDENQTSDHEVTLADVRELVDEAIYYANKKTPGHFMDILFGKRYDQEDMIVLREKDFMHY